VREPFVLSFDNRSFCSVGWILEIPQHLERNFVMTTRPDSDEAAVEYSLRYALGSASAKSKAVKSLASAASLADFSRKWQVSIA